MAAGIQTFRFDEARGREVGTTRGRGVDGGTSPDLKVVLYPIDTGISEINLRFGYDEVGDGFYTPRHRHNFDQFRYLVSGEMNLAKGVDLHEGECAYFPEGAHYGPLVQKGPASLLVLQFPGPNGAYRIKDSEKRAAMAALKSSGYFEDGLYKRRKPDGGVVNQDSYEAVWEQHMGRPISYASPRYRSPIVMRAQALRWIADPRRSGIEIRHMGSFTEFQTAVALWRIAPGVTIPSEILAAPELRCVLSGDTVYDGKELDRNGCYYMPENITTHPLRSRNGAELLVFTLPMYARATWERMRDPATEAVAAA